MEVIDHCKCHGKSDRKKKQTNKQNKQKESQKKPKTNFETIYLENQYKELGGNDMTIED